MGIGGKYPGRKGIEGEMAGGKGRGKCLMEKSPRLHGIYIRHCQEESNSQPIILACYCPTPLLPVVAC